MKTNPLLLSGVVLSLVISGVSLGTQMLPTKYEKYRNINATDLQRRFLALDIMMIRGRMPLRDGVGVPFFSGISSDGKNLLIRAEVNSAALPKTFDDRREAMLLAAGNARFGFAVAFGDDPNLKFENDAVVEFVDLALLLGSDGKQGVIASYQNEKLTFH
jgi:hypothetical protein